MLLCREQKNPIVFQGREVRISDKAANAHYHLCNLPVTGSTVGIYVGFALKGDEKNMNEKIKKFSDEQLTKIVEDGVKDEFLNLLDVETWNSIEG